MAVNPIASSAYATAQALPALHRAPPAPGAPRYDEARERPDDANREDPGSSSDASGQTQQTTAQSSAVGRGFFLNIQL